MTRVAGAGCGARGAALPGSPQADGPVPVQLSATGSDRPGVGEVGLRGDEGSALLLVVAATAALVALTALLLGAARQAREIAVLRADRLQAELLAAAGIERGLVGLRNGSLAIPATTAAATVRGEAPPVAPAGFLALPAGPPAAPGSAARDCGFRTTVTLVAGPDGMPRTAGLATTPPVSGRLLRIVAEGWCGRAAARRTARAVAVAPGTVLRLD